MRGGHRCPGIMNFSKADCHQNTYCKFTDPPPPFTLHANLVRNDTGNRQSCSNAVPWFRRLVPGLSTRRPGFELGSVRVGFVVDKVTLGQVFLQVVRFSPVIIFLTWLSILIYHLGCEQKPVGGSVQRHDLTPST
jgi:hypothetical protein